MITPGIRGYQARRNINLLIVSLALGACSGVNTREPDGRLVRMSKDEFAEYVEATFRHHNRIVNDLILASSLADEELLLDPALLKAEETMASACHPLNAMVSATIEGRELSFWSKLRLIDQVPECAAATNRVKELIPESF